MRLLRMLLWELLFLFRYGFVYAYLFVLAVYSGILFAVPSGPARVLAGTALIYSDIAMLGLIFMGASLHLERQSGAIAAVGVTPVASGTIVAGRAAAMALLSGFIALMLFLVAAGGPAGTIPLTAGVVGAAATFSCFGISLMTRTGNLSRYIILSGIVSLPAGLPLLALFGIRPEPLFSLLPGSGPLQLMLMAGRGGESGSLAAALANTVFWGCIAFLLAARDFRRRLIEGGAP